jgi:hypothetical protein
MTMNGETPEESRLVIFLGRPERAPGHYSTPIGAQTTNSRVFAHTLSLT